MRPLGALEPVLSIVTLPPGATVVADALMLAVGPSAVTATVLVALPVWPSASVTTSVTVNVPLPLPSVDTVAVLALVAVVNVARFAGLPLAGVTVHW